MCDASDAAVYSNIEQLCCHKENISSYCMGTFSFTVMAYIIEASHEESHNEEILKPSHDI